MPQTVTMSRVYQIIIVILVLLVAKEMVCNGGRGKGDTVTIDTTWRVHVDSSKESKPTPINISFGNIPSPTPTIVYVPGQEKPDTIWVPIDTLAVLNDFYSRVEYDTTYLFPYDTSNRFPASEVRVKNMVSENRLQRQQVFLKYHFPEIKQTITENRFQVYVGGGLYGGPMEPLFGADLQLAIRTKGGKVYEAGPVFLKDRPIMYRAGAKILISFRKK